MPRKIPFENIGTSFSSLEILQGPEVDQDQVNSEIWNTLKLLTVDGEKKKPFSTADG